MPSKRMEAKLDGRDPDPGYRMNVSEQVSMIMCCVSHDVRCCLYRSSSLLKKLPVLITSVSCTRGGLHGYNYSILLAYTTIVQWSKIRKV